MKDDLWLEKSRVEDFIQFFRNLQDVAWGSDKSALFVEKLLLTR